MTHSISLNPPFFSKFLFLFLLLPHFAMSHESVQRFESFLSEHLLLTPSEVACVSDELASQIESISPSLMDEFLLLAQGMPLQGASGPDSPKLGALDARTAAPAAHRLVFENRHVRILESVLKPGQTVPFHTHQWDSLILSTSGSYVRCDDGIDVFEEEWPPMAEVVDGSLRAHAFEIIGEGTYRGIVIEFKPS